MCYIVTCNETKHDVYVFCCGRVASSLILVTSQRSLRRTEKLKHSVLGIGEDALGKLSRVIKEMKQIQYLLFAYNQKITEQLNTTVANFRNDSRVIRRFVDTSGQTFGIAIHTSYAFCRFPSKQLHFDYAAFSDN